MITAIKLTAEQHDKFESFPFTDEKWEAFKDLLIKAGFDPNKRLEVEELENGDVLYYQED